MIDFGVAKAVSQKLTEETRLHALLADGRHAALHEPRAGGTGRRRYRHPQRRLFAGRAAVRTADRQHPVRQRDAQSRPASTRCGGSSARTSRPSPARWSARSRRKPSRPSRNAAAAIHGSSPIACQGELDWLVMKALEKDRNRRYESASALAADVERYLTGEPVEACPPSATYRLRKLVRRNNAALVTAIAVMATLLLGIAGTTWQAWAQPRLGKRLKRKRPTSWRVSACTRRRRPATRRSAR